MTATVAVTFDNLGEASDLERGWWPEDEPLGSHHSVTKVLPPAGPPTTPGYREGHGLDTER